MEKCQRANGATQCCGQFWNSKNRHQVLNCFSVRLMMPETLQGTAIFYSATLALANANIETFPTKVPSVIEGIASLRNILISCRISENVFKLLMFHAISYKNILQYFQVGQVKLLLLKYLNSAEYITKRYSKAPRLWIISGIVGNTLQVLSFCKVSPFSSI